MAVHAGPRNPLLEFIANEETAAAALDAIPGWLGLHGHTHVARLWEPTPDGPVVKRRRRAGQVFSTQDPAGTLLACPGALTGKRPSYLLVDFSRQTVRWHSLGD